MSTYSPLYSLPDCRTYRLLFVYPVIHFYVLLTLCSGNVQHPSVTPNFYIFLSAFSIVYDSTLYSMLYIIVLSSVLPAMLICIVL